MSARSSARVSAFDTFELDLPRANCVNTAPKLRCRPTLTTGLGILLQGAGILYSAKNSRAQIWAGRHLC